MFEFSNPFSFFLLLLIPIVLLLRRMGLLSRLSLPLNLSDWNGGNFDWNKKGYLFLDIASQILCLLFYICLVFAFANPVNHFQQKIYTSKGSTIVFVVDVSPSMAARDIGTMSRLEAAKTSIISLAESNGGAELALVEMAETAAVVIPPTMDRNFFFHRLEGVNIGDLGDGTAIGTGLSCAIYHLDSSTSPKKSIVLITDGENNAGEIHPHTAARLSSEKGISLYVLGIGTNGIVPVEYVDPKTGKLYSGYLESEFDISVMSEIASQGNGKFFEIESLSSLSQAISSISKNEDVAQRYQIKNQDTFYYKYFLFASVVCICLSWFIRRIVLKEIL